MRWRRAGLVAASSGAGVRVRSEDPAAGARSAASGETSGRRDTTFDDSRSPRCQGVATGSRVEDQGCTACRTGKPPVGNTEPQHPVPRGLVQPPQQRLPHRHFRIRRISPHHDATARARHHRQARAGRANEPFSPIQKRRQSRDEDREHRSYNVHGVRHQRGTDLFVIIAGRCRPQRQARWETAAGPSSQPRGAPPLDGSPVHVVAQYTDALGRSWRDDATS